MLIRDLIEKYIAAVHPMKPFGASHLYTLQLLQALPIGEIHAEKLKAFDLLEHCRGRIAGTWRKKVCAATVTQDLTYLRGPFGFAKIGLDLPDVSLVAFVDVKPLLEKYNLVGKGRPRDRRPTQDEIDRLLDHFRAEGRKHEAPMADICEFQIASCRRIGETCRLKWGDVDFDNKTMLVRDMKDPKHKVGNNHRFALLGRAWDVLMAQPRLTTDPAERIFPYRAKSVSAAYARAKKALGIEGLRLHDSRREGASRLFEEGYGVPEVMVMTGHKTPNLLMRVYTKLDAANLHGGPASKRVLNPDEPSRENV